MLEISRRLNLALNPVKRCARIDQPERLVRAPQYRPTLVDPFPIYLRQRREQDPAVPVLQLFHEITERGYTGNQNRLYRYITQGRVEADRPAMSPKRLIRHLLTHPDKLHDHQRERIDTATDAFRGDGAGLPHLRLRRTAHARARQQRVPELLD